MPLSPIALWIDTLNFDEMMAEPDLAISIPEIRGVLGATPSPRTAKDTSFICNPFTSSHDGTETSLLNTLLDDVVIAGNDHESVTVLLDLDEIAIDEFTEAPKCATPSVKHSLKSEKKTKIARRNRNSSTPIDKVASGQRRRTKQRGYEKQYRGRLRAKRSHDEAEWIQLEMELRHLLVDRKRAHIHQVTSRRDTVVRHSGGGPKSASPGLLKKYKALLKEEKDWHHLKAVSRCDESWSTAADLWGGNTETGRGIREQINKLPSLHEATVFDFTW